MDGGADMISVVFIRHGATKGNLEKRYIGKTDEPLCDIGVAQALRLKEHKFPDERIYISPMKRTVQTAELIFPDKKYLAVEDFRETDFGIFEGKNAQELSGSSEYFKWVDSMCTLPIPGGEDIAEFKKRCVDAFGKITDSLPDGSEVSFVVHGGVIMAIMEAFCDSGAGFYDYHIKNGDFLICKFENGKILDPMRK